MKKPVCHDSDPEGTRLPVKIDSTSNGEYEPIPLEVYNALANDLALERATKNAKRLNHSRRKFLTTTMAVATTLATFNQINAAHGKTASFFELAEGADMDADAADSTLAGNEFIFDVHGHYANVGGEWTTKAPEGVEPFGGFMNRPQWGKDAFIKDIFLDSDTDMMVLTFVPSMADAEPLTIEEAAATRAIIDDLSGTKRLLLHGRVAANQPGDLDRMQMLVEEYDVAAFKTYTQWGPAPEAYYTMETGGGYALDEDIGLQMIEQARALGVNNIAIHKGIPFGRGDNYKFARCDDIGRVAKMYPDMNFLVYHAGWDPAVPELPFANGAGRNGIDSLVQSLLDNGIAPGSNVYADLGSTWAFIRRDMNTAAHAMGKLLKYVGEDNVIWGTDAVWTGSPQDQIQSFRAFQIAPEVREEHSYPEMTPALRAKVFGLNATRPYKISAEEVQKRAEGDHISDMKRRYAENPNPHFQTFGPKNRREFLNLKKWQGKSA